MRFVQGPEITVAKFNVGIQLFQYYLDFLDSAQHDLDKGPDDVTGRLQRQLQLEPDQSASHQHHQKGPERPGQDELVAQRDAT